MKKIVSLTAILLICTNCSSELITKPMPFGMMRGMQDGAPAGTVPFRSGWKAGCESGMAAYGPLHYKNRYGYTYDASYLDNGEYHNAWRIGFRHCRWYTAEWTKWKL